MLPLFAGYGGSVSSLVLRDGALQASYFTRKGRLQTRVERGKQRPLLFADSVWPGSLVLAKYLAGHTASALLSSSGAATTVLEMGAGEACLPSVAAIKTLAAAGAEYRAVVTDYPESSIFENISEVLNHNSIQHSFVSADDNSMSPSTTPVAVTPLDWGSSSDEERVLSANRGEHFDLILQAECLWADTHGLHRKLLQSTRALLKPSGTLLVCYADRDAPSYRACERNADFFRLAREEFGLESRVLLTSQEYCDNDDSEQLPIEVKLVEMWFL